jgi:hypothetical protein
MIDIRLIRQHATAVAAMAKHRLPATSFAPPPSPKPAIIDDEARAHLMALQVAGSVLLVATARATSDPRAWLREARASMERPLLVAIGRDGVTPEAGTHTRNQLDALFWEAEKLLLV